LKIIVFNIKIFDYLGEILNLAIIQARMGSTRFPDKILREIIKIPLLEHIIYRVKNAKCVNNVIIATTVNKKDNILIKWLKENNYLYYRGSEDDVLDRFYQTAKMFPEYKNIIRITADDPFKDPEVIDKIFEKFIEENVDYASNTIEPSYPEGLDIEIFTFKALEIAWKYAKLKSEREHVTPYIWKNPKKFSLYSYKNTQNLSFYRWTIDYLEDFEFTKKIFEELYPKKKLFLMEDILNLFQTNSNIKPRTTKDIQRNEGYLKSLKNDNMN
jgi:spore coat polysaccharide biosynthesis protein SpsF